MDTPFEIVLHKSGRRLQVEPDKTMLETLLDAGVEVAFSCMQGMCGTCETKVISGVPEHRDLYLSEAEQASNGTVMVCCSRANSLVLVLDL